MPASERWRTLAAAKLAEVDAVIARAQGMRRVLEQALRCGCLRLEDCAALGWDGERDQGINPKYPYRRSPPVGPLPNRHPEDTRPDRAGGANRPRFCVQQGRSSSSP